MEDNHSVCARPIANGGVPFNYLRKVVAEVLRESAIGFRDGGESASEFMLKRR